MKYPRTRSRIQELAGINEALKPADTSGFMPKVGDKVLIGQGVYKGSVGHVKRAAKSVPNDMGLIIVQMDTEHAVSGKLLPKKRAVPVEAEDLSWDTSKKMWIEI